MWLLSQDFPMRGAKKQSVVVPTGHELVWEMGDV